MHKFNIDFLTKAKAVARVIDFHVTKKMQIEKTTFIQSDLEKESERGTTDYIRNL